MCDPDTDAIINVIPSFRMWTRGAVILRVMSVKVVTLTRSLLHYNLSKTSYSYTSRCRPVFQSADEHVEEVDEGELDEGREHRHEADDDEHVQCSGVANLDIRNMQIKFSLINSE